MTQASTTPETRGGVPDVVAPPRSVGRWITAAVLIAVGAVIVHSVATNPNIDYVTVGKFLFDPRILSGLLTTLQLAIIAMLLGIALGIVVALLRLSSNPVASAVGWLYVWVFRGTPLLVQVLIWGNFALFYSRIELGIPFTEMTLWSWDTNALITTFVASVLALSLHEAALMAEIIRSGIVSVNRGQTEAALALGLTPRQLMRKVVLPQALRVIVPPTGNQVITMLKMTALVAVIAGGDLLTAVLNISAVNLKTMELLIVATIWYLAVISITTVGQAILEQRLSRGFGASTQRTKRRTLGRKPASNAPKESGR